MKIFGKEIQRATLYNFHSWMGLITGFLMILIAVSGSIAVFNDEIEWLATPEIRADPAKELVSVDKITKSIRTDYDQSSFEIFFPPGNHWTYSAETTTEQGALNLLFDPGSGQITKVRPRGGYTWSLSFWIRQFHVRLLMGLWGRVFVGIFGVTLIISCITGLLVYRNWIKSMFQLRRGRRPRVFYMDLHKLIGFWSLIFNIMIGFTGAFLGLENLYNQIQRKWLDPPTQTQVISQEVTPQSPDTSQPQTEIQLASTLISRAQSHFPQMKITRISFPRFDPNRTDPIVIRGDHPGPLIATGQSRVIIDPYSGNVLSSLDAREVDTPSFLYNMLDPLHHGYLGKEFGSYIKYLIKTLWAILGLTPGILAITGSMMWWMRNRRRTATQGQPTKVRTAWEYGLLGSLPFLVLGYAIQATIWRNGWNLDLEMLQHWLVKPISLMAACFPVTVYLYNRSVKNVQTLISQGTSLWLTPGAIGFLGLWYVLTSCLLN